eukprot:1572212-Rhodomonas_salina.2
MSGPERASFCATRWKTVQIEQQTHSEIKTVASSSVSPAIRGILAAAAETAHALPGLHEKRPTGNIQHRAPPDPGRNSLTCARYSRVRHVRYWRTPRAMCGTDVCALPTRCLVLRTRMQIVLPGSEEVRTVILNQVSSYARAMRCSVWT